MPRISTVPWRRPRFAHLFSLAALIILADQLSKALFVYLLGAHRAPDFISFALKYFTLWGATDGSGSIHDTYFPYKAPIDVWQPWIQFNLTTNTGAAWSIFAGNSFYLSFVSLAMALLLYYVWWRSFRTHSGMTWALGAIIGGALGNFVDRFRLKEVVDFIDCKIPYIGQVFPSLGNPYCFPIFNVADSCAVCGTLALAMYLIVTDLRGMLRAAHARRQAAAPAGTEAPPSPWDGGLEVDPQAFAELKRKAAAVSSCTRFGLTVHIALPDVDSGEQL